MKPVLSMLACTVGASGCTASWVMPSAPGFDACRTECRVLEDLDVPMCLIREAPNDELRAMLSGVYDAIDSSIEPREGACGCFTATVDPSARFVDVQRVYSWRVEDPDGLVGVIEGYQSNQPISERANCIVGRIVPIRFFE